MSEFIIHSVPGSPYGRAVLATLEEKGAKYQVMPVGSGGSKVEPHISRHPFGKVPVLEHDGYMLYETQAILRYLDRVIPDPQMTPADVRKAARMDQILNVCDCYLMRGVNDIIGFQRIVGPRLLGLAPDEMAIAAAMPNAQVVIKVLSDLLGAQDYFCGEALTLADMLVAPHLDFLAQTPEWATLTVTSPNMVYWLLRMNERLSMANTTWERVAEMARTK